MLPSIFREDLFDEMMSWPFGDDFFGERNPLYGKHGKNMMNTDVKEEENHYQVDVDLPGFKKEDISARLDNGYLTITASKGIENEKQDKKGRYIRRERYAGSCTRSFYVGDGINQDDIMAKYEDGILKLTIAKKEVQEIESNKQIAIEG